MKKLITITMTVENDDENPALTDDFIRNDLEQEINCASNYYEIVSIETKVIG